MDHAPNFLNTPVEVPPDRESRRILVLLIFSLIFLIVAATLGGFIFTSSAGFSPGTIIAKLRSLTAARDKMLQGEENERINVLLLGMGGAGHDGATLTDTIIFASVRPPRDKSFRSDAQVGKVGLLSIPRDLQVVIPKIGYGRINAVNAYAERDNPGGGASASAEVVSKVLGQPIHYYLRVDFQAFKEIIDTVGGIEVEVERTFVDTQYPDENFGYRTVSFEKGRQRMSGTRALEFVRSRHGSNGEGNDFARSRRQQKVLLALKERLISFDVLLRPQRIKSIVESLSAHIQTNIVFWEGVRFVKLLKNIDDSAVTSHVLDDGPQGILQARQSNGAFVLEPKDGTWTAVREIAAQLLE